MLKNLLLRRLCLFTFAVIILHGASAQNAPYVPNVIPPSPNAATLGKFGDLPVSTYTGTTDISVPIFSIQAKGVTVPVGLSYHTGGIRLSEEAGWVGLGWALNAGGMISRSIVGKDDFLSGGYINSNSAIFKDVKGKFVQQPIFNPYFSKYNFGLYGYHFDCRYNVYTEYGTQYLFQPLVAEFNSPGAFDFEPDIYNFSFLGRSGKFTITRDKKIVLQKQENLKISFAANGDSFIIVDEQGNSYIFLDKEYNQPTIGGTSHISSWLLSKIITQQKDSVLFTYSNDNTWTTVHGNVSETIRTGGTNQGTTISNDPGQDYINRTLKNIDYANAQIQFSFDSVRSDLKNGRKLNNVKLFSKDQGNLKYIKEEQFFYSYFESTESDTLEFRRLRLDSVREVSGTTSLPAYAFSYNTPQFGTQFLSKHSTSVDHWGYFNGVSNSGFTPSYMGLVHVGTADALLDQLVNLPGANREPNGTNMTAFSLASVRYPTGGKTTIDYEANEYDWFNSMNQRAGLDFIQVPVISKSQVIVINTKNDSTGTINLSNLYIPIPASVGTNATINVSFRAMVSDSLNKYHNTFSAGKIAFNFLNQTFDIISANQCSGIISNGNCSGTVYSIAQNINITSGTNYTWTSHIDPNVSLSNGLAEIRVTLTWNELLYNNTTIMTGGGIRVKQITDYTSDNKFAKRRTYDYGYFQDRNGDGTPEHYSYGRLMGFISYGRYEIFGDNSISFTRYSNSNTSLTSQSSGNIVGYDQVTEYIVDSLSGNGTGKTVFRYNNNSDTTFSYSGYRFPGMQNLPSNLNGTLRSKSVYSSQGANYYKVSSVDNFYRTANRTIINSMKYWQPPGTTRNQAGAISSCPTPSNPSMIACKCPGGIDSAQYEVLAFFYPALSSEIVLLDSTVERNFDQYDTTTAITKTTKNFYDNAAHYQLTRSSSVDSKGNKTVTYIKYPQDYLVGTATQTGNTVLDTLINRNMWSETIEKRDSLYLAGASTGAVKNAQLTGYRLLSNLVIAPDKIYKLDLSTPATNFQPFAISGNTSTKDSRYRQVISFDSYDNLKNVLQYTTVDNTPVSFIWDYKQVYPIAQVKNAASADIAYTSFETDGSGNWTIPSIVRDNSTVAVTGKQSYNLNNGSISKSGLTNGKTYTISYWSNNGAKTLAGGSASTTQGRYVNGWTYYETKTTVSGTSITLSGSGLIDELRLYPSGALMTSYTYDPLVGQTAMADPNGEITYYEYDPLTRLKNIKDYQGSIVKNFQYNYQSTCGNNCVVLPMQTFIGTNTLSYPVGVFSVTGQLLGSASNQTQYISLWNSNATNLAKGVLAAGVDSMHFNLTLVQGQQAPAAVTGLRYYQFDIESNNIDAFEKRNGEVVDLGDGVVMRLGNSFNPNSLPPNTSAFGSEPFIYIVHTYPSNSLRTVTFYHNDAGETNVLDNWINPATSLMSMKNIRGNFPQFTPEIGGTCHQFTSMNTLNNITNWNSIASVTYFVLHNGDGQHPCTNINYVQNFMANNKGLRIIKTAGSGFYAAGYRDTSFKISRMKSDWNTFFTSLETIQINEDHWSHEDLSALKQLKTFVLVATTQDHTDNQSNNPVVPLAGQVIDNVLIQIAAGAGTSGVVNGTVNFISVGPNPRSTSSDAAFNLLKSKGWTIIINGTNQ